MTCVCYCDEIIFPEKNTKEMIRHIFLIFHFISLFRCPNSGTLIKVIYQSQTTDSWHGNIQFSNLFILYLKSINVCQVIKLDENLDLTVKF